MFKFNKTEVYTALDADELETDDVVAVADTLYELEHKPKIRTLDYIRVPSEQRRFVCDEHASWEYAQLIAKHDDPLRKQKMQDALQQGNKPGFDLLDRMRINEHFEGLVTAIKYDEACGWLYCCGNEWWKEDRLEKVEEEQC